MSELLPTFAPSELKYMGGQIMTTITITHELRKIKSFRDISLQCERIFTLHINGYGTDKMYRLCESIYFKVLEKNGY